MDRVCLAGCLGREVSGRQTGWCATLAAAVWYFVMGMADADYLTGNKLFEECQQNSNLFLSGACLGYIAGVVDALHTSSEFCVLQNGSRVKLRQLVDVVTDYLHDHPEKRQLPASDLVIAAAKNQFPCN